MIEYYKQLKQFGHVKLNAPLAKQTTFRVGGTAQLLVEVTETEKLVGLLNFLSGEGIEYIILGGGSNVLMPDDQVEKIVIKILNHKSKIINQTIEAESGAFMATVVNLAASEGLTGLEWAAGLPGTVGGAVRGGVGAQGSGIVNCLEKVEVWQNGEVVTLLPNECKFGYRDSIFKYEPMVVLRAWFKLAVGDKKQIMGAMQNILLKRVGFYPKLPSAGSFFKNIKLANWPGATSDLLPKFVTKGEVPAGWLIQEAGLKGLKVGGAMVSNEHGNFLVNNQNATQAEILALVEKIKEAVYNKFKVSLEEEVEIIT